MKDGDETVDVVHVDDGVTCGVQGDERGVVGNGVDDEEDAVQDGGHGEIVRQAIEVLDDAKDEMHDEVENDEAKGVEMMGKDVRRC